MRHLLPLLLLTFGALALGGCGNKGPLQLPAPTRPQAAAPAHAASVAPPPRQRR